jgi:hypothetical protein
VEIINAHTVVVFVLICFVSQLGSGHSNHESSIPIDDFDFAALPSDKLLVRKYWLIAAARRFDGDNSIFDDCRVAVESVRREFACYLVDIWDLLRIWQSVLRLFVCSNEHVNFFN